MIPARAVADARQAQHETGVSTLAAALALAVAGPESGWDPSAAGDWMLGGRIVPRSTPGAIATSWGYTQLHTNAGGDGGGLGNGYSVAQLTDGVANFAIAMRHIQAALDRGADPRAALQPWTAREGALSLLPEALDALGGSADLVGPGNGEVRALAMAILGLVAAFLMWDLVGG